MDIFYFITFYKNLPFIKGKAKKSTFQKSKAKHFGATFPKGCLAPPFLKVDSKGGF
jgi:hypothetical protein